jgi:cytidylate kinase
MKIAIDGPSASGKSTIARLLSQRLGIPYLETGLLYRFFGYLAYKRGTTELLPDELFKEDFKVVIDVGKTEVYWKGKRLSEELRGEEVGRYASLLGEVPAFRERMIKFFRELVGSSQVVGEGRDVGTHIFPQADYKFFITASPEERARRRYLELKEKGVAVSYEDILKSNPRKGLQGCQPPAIPFQTRRGCPYHRYYQQNGGRSP